MRDVSVGHDARTSNHMINTSRAIRRWMPKLSVVVLVMLGAAGCVDAPTVASPNALADNDPLAQTLDALAIASANSGDLGRKESFEVAALAVRSGVTPSHL